MTVFPKDSSSSCGNTSSSSSSPATKSPLPSTATLLLLPPPPPSRRARKEWGRDVEHKEVVHPRQWYTWLEFAQHYPMIVALGCSFYRSMRTMWKLKSDQWPMSKWSIGEIDPWIALPPRENLKTHTDEEFQQARNLREAILYNDVTKWEKRKPPTKTEQVETQSPKDDEDKDDEEEDSGTQCCCPKRVSSSRKIIDADPLVLGAIGWVPLPWDHPKQDACCRHRYEKNLGYWLLNALRHQKNTALVFLKTLPPGHFNLDDVVTDRHSTAMILAAQDNFCAAIAEMLRLNAGLNHPREDGFTPLHAAAYWDAPEAVQYLCSCKADMTLANEDCDLPIHCAAYHLHNDRCLKALAAAGARVNISNSSDWLMTAAHIASRSGSVACLKALTTLGGDLLARDSEGWWSAHYAIFNGHVSVLEYLVDDLKLDIFTIEEESIRKMNIGAGFFQVGCAVDKGLPALHWLHNRFPHKDLINTPNLAIAGVTKPIYEACANGAVDVIEFLLDHGADSVESGGPQNLSPLSYLRFASFDRRPQAIRALVNHKNSLVRERQLSRFARGGDWEITSSATTGPDAAEQRDLAVDIARVAKYSPGVIKTLIEEWGVSPFFSAHNALNGNAAPALATPLATDGESSSSSSSSGEASSREQQPPHHASSFLRFCAESLDEEFEAVATYLVRNQGVPINEIDCGDEMTVLDLLRKNFPEDNTEATTARIEREKEFIALGARSGEDIRAEQRRR